jgi:hypothetical protein
VRAHRCRCGKRLYRDEVAAMIALARLQKDDRPNCREVRYYSCPRTQGFHLTSQKAKTHAAV